MAYELQNSLPDPVQAVNTQSDEEWDVEVILRARYMKSEAKEVTKTGSKIIPGRWEYLIKWAGYDESANSWEPDYNVKCPRLVKEFWEEFDFAELEVEDIVDGEVLVSKEWIKYQKEVFSNHYIVTMIDDVPPVEEIYDPQAEPGSSSDEDDEEEEERHEQPAGQQEKERLTLLIPAQSPRMDSAAPQLLDAEEQEHAHIRTCPSTPQHDLRNVYPSPMSIDDGNSDWDRLLTLLEPVDDLQDIYPSPMSIDDYYDYA